MDTRSEEIGMEMGIDISMIRDFRYNYSMMESDFQFKDFPIYSNRLQTLQKQIHEWRPRTIRELAIRPYQQPLGFYAFWFATIFGTIGILILGTSIAQTYASFKVLSLQINGNEVQQTASGWSYKLAIIPLNI
jgi:hypothetical protein